MVFRNYDPKQILATFREVLLQGFGDGDFISAERSEDAFTTVVGAGGDVSRVRSHDATGLVTVTLLAESAANDSMMNVYNLDQSEGSGFGALLITNLNGTTVLDAPDAWIMKLPDVTYSKDGAGTREWQIACAQLTMFVGGALA